MKRLRVSGKITLLTMLELSLFLFLVEVFFIFCYVGGGLIVVIAS